MWKKSERMRKRRSVREGTMLLSPHCMHGFLSVFPKNNSLLLQWPHKFQWHHSWSKVLWWTTPGSWKQEFRGSSMKLCQVYYVHTPSCFPTTEGIRKLTCSVCGGILTCFDHRKNCPWKQNSQEVKTVIFQMVQALCLNHCWLLKADVGSCITLSASCSYLDY